MSSPTIERSPKVGLGIDPRLRARRVAVLRDEGRRRLYRLIALGAIAALVLGAFLLTRSPLLDVDRIRVTGNSHTPLEQVLSTSGIRTRQPMIGLDLGAIRARLDALPWVESVSVARSWPGTVTIEIHERKAVAALPAPGGGVALLDITGRVLDVQPTLPNGTVALAGLAAPGAPGSSLDARAADLLRVVEALSPRLREQVVTVALEADGVELWLRDAAKVRLGSTSDLGAKLLAATTVLEQVDLSQLCAIDVRVPSAPSLTRMGACL